MVDVICGPMGAGKSTYAKENYTFVTEFEDTGSKRSQLDRTLKGHAAGKRVAHVTCWPTSEEMEVFRELPKDQIRFIWIGTPGLQCRKNVLKRGRERDMGDITRVFRCIRDLTARVRGTSIPFKIIDVFTQDERW